MAQLTLDALRTILVACAGEDDSVDLSGDILDVTFEDLGYDSLALMESASRIEREFGVSLSDDDVNEELTPRLLLDLVNATVAEAA
ncbi:actinorhodin polyketide synthase [Streptomyces sp. SID486]|uniref:acyl carrier protein n=1 Tax=unclassified Streptomyces TaxID=2593676 RepID=UPI00136A46DB|nr:MULTISPECIES: acyl carrier protein [unclassified Streptomyces]MYW17769.1 actinorhodin polyketide synthase [Streptomyces sp. SID2955]MYW42211.1 actinorhodin polyketide synthase [Streptomyces sp. SID161]MYX96184.1 actinorhodin polyketide synthase [Streptomyces sp. SID486]MYX97275.1 actinorhodin polyketide synthase [Streptomyces sp. SID486]